MAKVLGAQDWDRVSEVSDALKRAKKGTEDARRQYHERTGTPDQWRQAIAEEATARQRYWEVWGEYMTLGVAC
jgi:hypothetical protein